MIDITVQAMNCIREASIVVFRILASEPCLRILLSPLLLLQLLGQQFNLAADTAIA